MQPQCRPSLALGGPGAISQLHRGPLVWPSWDVLVLGEKRWRLFPPSSVPGKLSASLGSWGSGSSHLNSFEADSPLGHVEVWEATQTMGDVMLLPVGWWHQEQHTDKTLSVAAPFLTPDTLSTVIQHLSNWLGTKPRGRDELEMLSMLCSCAAEQEGLHSRPIDNTRLPSGMLSHGVLAIDTVLSKGHSTISAAESGLCEVPKSASDWASVPGGKYDKLAKVMEAMTADNASSAAIELDRMEGSDEVAEGVRKGFMKMLGNCVTRGDIPIDESDIGPAEPAMVRRVGPDFPPADVLEGGIRQVGHYRYLPYLYRSSPLIVLRC